MKEKKEMKISLGTAITLVIVFLVLVVGMIYIIINATKQNNNNISEGNNIAGSNNIIDVNSITDDNNSFDIKFLKLENNKENMIYSPLSIKYALKMLNEGAEGNTKKQCIITSK